MSKTKKRVCKEIILLHAPNTSYIECDPSADKTEILDSLIDLFKMHTSNIETWKAELKVSYEQEDFKRIDDLSQNLNLGKIMKTKVKTKIREVLEEI